VITAERIEIVGGVECVSRHGVDRELLRMRRSVECLPSDLRGKLLSYFCDSKVGDAYLLTVSEEDAASEIAQYLSPLRASFIAFECRGKRVLEWVS
jgi:hypothetical protein